MSTGEKKPTSPPQTASPAQAPTVPAKQPLVSRRTFLKAAVGASVVLAGASMASSGEILSPLIPAAKAKHTLIRVLLLLRLFTTGSEGKRGWNTRLGCLSTGPMIPLSVHITRM